ncbi:MAG: alpha/beta hydrolase [Actinomycetota bacterium]
MTTNVAWFETDAAEPLSVAIVVHGLNTKASLMDELIEVLVAGGHHCARVSLYGSGGVSAGNGAPVRERWREIYASACDEAATRFPTLPLTGVAFSLGSLITLDYLGRDPTRSFKSLVLLAPPLSLRPVAQLVRYLVPLSRTGLRLPSAAPKSVRQRWATPLSEYSALLDLASDVGRVADGPRLRQTPCLVMVSPNDELVDAAGVSRWVEAHGLGARWTTTAVMERRSITPSRRHLIVTEASIGAEAWRSLRTAVLDHLR